jgi:hypothetical protein
MLKINVDAVWCGLRLEQKVREEKPRWIAVSCIRFLGVVHPLTFDL